MTPRGPAPRALARVRARVRVLGGLTALALVAAGAAACNEGVRLRVKVEVVDGGTRTSTAP